MQRSLRPLLLCLSLLACALSPFAVAAEEAATGQSAAQHAFQDAVNRLDWVKGPTTVDIAGNSRLAVPQGYAFLDRRNTDKFLELTQNLPSGNEVLVAPEGLDWIAYLSFSDEGYVKDNDKIDAAELLKGLQEGAKEGNQERRSRGWAELQVVGWAVPPAYNSDTKRLEWATVLESQGKRDVNFSTKVLGRRGHTSVILVTAPDGPRGRAFPAQHRARRLQLRRWPALRRLGARRQSGHLRSGRTGAGRRRGHRHQEGTMGRARRLHHRQDQAADRRRGRAVRRPASLSHRQKKGG